METQKETQKSFIPASIIIGAFMVSVALLMDSIWGPSQAGISKNISENLDEQGNIAFAQVALPVVWGDLGIKMLSVGVIDEDKLKALYRARGGFSEDLRKLLYENDNGNLVINAENAGEILNLLWALGLGTKNPILDSGEMVNPKYGGAGNFASTAGWTLAKGDAMEHFSRHPFIVLTADEQQLVERVSKGIFRPCCNNATHFPDCNHGMAMLGLLELMASQGVSEDEMYKAALAVNALWFPDTYATISKYLNLKGRSLATADPKELLGATFSSGSGYRQILNQVTAPAGGQSSGGGRV